MGTGDSSICFVVGVLRTQSDARLAGSYNAPYTCIADSTY